MVLLYTGAHVSGAHYNPAVTLAVFVRGGIGWVEAWLFVCLQVAGAWTGTLLCFLVKGRTHSAYPSVPDETRLWSSFLAEMLFTLALCTTYLQVCTSRAHAGNSYSGMACGFIVLASVLAVGGISGGCLNPALGSTAMLQFKGADIPLYWIAPCTGGLLAGLSFRLTNAAEFPAQRGGETLLKLSTLAAYYFEFLGTFML